jgi:putative transcriptional regulator
VSARFHPDDAVLADFATGRMRPGFDLVVAVHLEGCSQCRRRVGAFEAEAGSLMAGLSPEPLAEDALAHALALLDREPKPAAVAPPEDKRPLVERLPLKGRRWLAPGNWVQPVDTTCLPGDRVYLLRVAGGLQGLPHGHRGLELTTVIYGAFREGETTYRAGDFMASDPSERHQPQVLADDGGCLCLAATQGPLATKGFLDGLIQAWAGV